MADVFRVEPRMFLRFRVVRSFEPAAFYLSHIHQVRPMGSCFTRLEEHEWEWDARSATGWREVEYAPQFRFILAEAEPRVRISVQRLPVGEQDTCFSFAVVSSRGLRVAKCSSTCADSVKVVVPLPRTFCRTKAEAEACLEAGVVYTIVVPTYDATGRGRFKIEFCNADTGAPLAVRLTPLGRKTIDQQIQEDAATSAVAVASREHERKLGVLELMRSAALATPPASQSRIDYLDYIDVVREVERRRAEVRARGPGARYEDTWSNTPGALGHWECRGQKPVWRWMNECAPHPAIVVNGFVAAALKQGELGDCSVISSLVHLVRLLAECPWAIDRILVTTDYNPEGVYCVRLWEGTFRTPRGTGIAARSTPWKIERPSGWTWYFLDAQLPTQPDAYWTPGSNNLWSGSPDAAQCKYALPAGVKSSVGMHEFWPCFFEKVLACRAGSYAHIAGEEFGSRDVCGSSPLLLFLPRAMPCITLDVTRTAKLASVESVTMWRSGPRSEALTRPEFDSGSNLSRAKPVLRAAEFVGAAAAPPIQRSALLEALSPANRSSATPEFQVQLRNHAEYTSDRDAALPTRSQWEAIRLFAERGWPMIIGARKFRVGEARHGPKSNADQHGIVLNHSYTVMRVQDRANSFWSLEVRNPHGTGDVRASENDGIFVIEFPSAVWESFERMTVTPLAPLANDGGTWHAARASAVIPLTAVTTDPLEQRLASTQFFISPRTASSGWVCLCVMPDDLWSDCREYEVCVWSSVYKGGGPLRALTVDDYSTYTTTTYPGKGGPPVRVTTPARAETVRGIAGNGKTSCWVWLDSTHGAGTLHVSVSIGGQHAAALRGRGYTLTAWAEVDFDLHAAEPGQPMRPAVPKLSDVVPAGPHDARLRQLPPVPQLSITHLRGRGRAGGQPAAVVVVQDNPMRRAGVQ